MLFLSLACNNVVEIVLTDENNFEFSSVIDADSVVVPSQEDSTVDWSALDADILGEPVSATADVGALSIVRFGGLSQEEVIDGINNETLKQSDLTGFVSYAPQGETSTSLSQFSISGTSVDVENDIVEDLGTYLISVEDTEGDYLTFVFFEPTVGAPPATIAVTGQSAVLSYSLDLDAGTPLLADDGEQVVVSWSQLTTNGSGYAMVLSNIDTLMLARYTLPLSDLEANFLQLEELADELYQVDVTGLGSYDLMELDGFAGFSGEGTWLLALRCSTCVNPSPPFVGLFE